MADWLENNKTSGADIEELIRLCKEYRTRDPEDESMDDMDYLEAVDDLLHVLPEGVDAHFCNLIDDVLRNADLAITAMFIVPAMAVRATPEEEALHA